MRDEIAHWTEQLVREPSSLAFVPLVDALRRARRLDEARRVALGGLERHPYHADAHDALARVYADGGDAQRARDEWEMALHLAPNHVAALRGMGFLAYREGDLVAAERFLQRALSLEPNDRALRAALERVRMSESPERTRHTPNGNGSAAGAPNGNSPAPAVPHGHRASPPVTAAGAARELFAPILGDGDRTALLLDQDGLVLAGTYVDHSGRDVAEEIGAEWSGVSDEAGRALQHLGLGAWTSLVIEAQHATLALAPAPDRGIVLIAAARDTQVGFVRRLLAQATARATAWLGDRA